MHKPRYLTDDEWLSAWCIGWYARRREDVVWIMHSGGHYGFITDACFEPKEKVGAIALLNGIGNATELALQLGTHRPRGGERGGAGDRGAGAAARSLAARSSASTRPRTSGRSCASSGSTASSQPSTPTLRPGSRRSRRQTDPDVFTIEPGFRESGELARFERGKDGRVISLFFAVARLQRLEPVS